MAYSYDSYTGDGGTEKTITFNYLPETVVVSADPKGIEVHLDGIKQTSGYTIDTSLNKVTITPGPATGVDIKILRVTPRGKADRLVDWADGTVFTEAQLDTMAIQLLYIAQEAFEQSASGGTVTPTYLAYDPTLGHWDATYNATAQTIKNLSEPQSDDSAASKLYVDNVATWGIAGVPQSWAFTGTGQIDTFTLTGGPYIEEEMLVVSIDGALQVPNTDFTVEQGATDSTIDFDVAPVLDSAISVQNFGKMRFLDGVSISDGSITTAKLDQTSGTEAVSTATMRDDAVTAAKIADGVVDFARVDTTTFTTSTGDTTPRFLSVPASGTGLSLGTLATEQIENFNTDVRAFRLDQFVAPASVVSFGSQKITNLADPTADQHAATRKYVDDEISASAADAGIVKISSHSLGTTATSFAITDWYDPAYHSYEFVCDGFAQTGDAGGAYILMEFADSGGTYRTSANNVQVWADGSTYPPSFNHKRGVAVGMMDDDNVKEAYANFKLWLPDNRAAVIRNKCIISEYTALVGANGINNGVMQTRKYVNYFTYNASSEGDQVVTKIRFRANDSTTNTSNSASIRAGAKVIVYGRTF